MPVVGVVPRPHGARDGRPASRWPTRRWARVHMDCYRTFFHENCVREPQTSHRGADWCEHHHPHFAASFAIFRMADDWWNPLSCDAPPTKDEHLRGRRCPQSSRRPAAARCGRAAKVLADHLPVTSVDGLHCMVSIVVLGSVLTLLRRFGAHTKQLFFVKNVIFPEKCYFSRIELLHGIDDGLLAARHPRFASWSPSCPRST